MAAEVHPISGELGHPFERFYIALGEVAFVGGLAVKFGVFVIPGSHFVGGHFEVVLILGFAGGVAVVVVLGLVVEVGLPHAEVGASQFLHGGFGEAGLPDLLSIEVLLVHGLHGGGHVSQVDSQGGLGVGLDPLGLLGREGGVVDCDFGKGLCSEADGILSSLNNLANGVPIFGGKLSTVGRLVVGMILFFEVVVVSSHIFFALLLVFGGIGGDLFFIVIDLVGGCCFLGVVVPQFEVMGLEFV